MMRPSLLRIVLPLLVAVTAMGAAPTPHPFAIADWQRLRSAEPVAVAPDGKTVLYSVNFGRANGPTAIEYFVIGSDGRGRAKLTLPKGFEPQGFTRSARELYGTQTSGALAQPARWLLGAKAATVIARIPGGIAEIRISPDGSRFAMIGDPRPPDPKSAIRTVVENDRSALYVTGLDGGNGAWWCPGHDRVAAFAWSQDGTRVAELEQTPKLGYHSVRGAIDVCTAASIRRVASIGNAASGIAWIDRDAGIAFLSTTTDVLTPDHLWTVAATGGTPVDRTPDIAYSIMGLHGDPRGRLLLDVSAGVEADVLEYRGGRLTHTYSNRALVAAPVTGQLRSAPDLMAFVVSTPTHPGEVAVATPNGLRRITHESDDQLVNIDFGRVVRHTWTAADGTKLEAIVTFPAGWNGKPGRFVIVPHGGPEGNDVFALDSRARILAGDGFVVMQPQYRGSTGYGSAFLEAIYQRFGDTAYRDVDAATSEAIAQGWADPERLAIFGWSAGGFMTSWTVTQTNRYKAAVEGAGITEWLSFIMTSDVQQTDYDARELGDGADPFLKYSAVMFTKNVTTPLLILHGENDVRVPTYQGRELFVLLKEEGKTVRMVTYPGSPHFPRRWEQRRNVMEETLTWLNRYDP
jgi:dipeptidyl aminopeptidase/acylaminoacyl peptidase